MYFAARTVLLNYFDKCFYNNEFNKLSFDKKIKKTEKKTKTILETLTMTTQQFFALSHGLACGQQQHSKNNNIRVLEITSFFLFEVSYTFV